MTSCLPSHRWLRFRRSTVRGAGHHLEIVKQESGVDDVISVMVGAALRGPGMLRASRLRWAVPAPSILLGPHAAESMTPHRVPWLDSPASRESILHLEGTSNDSPRVGSRLSGAGSGRRKEEPSSALAMYREAYAASRRTRAGFLPRHHASWSLVPRSRGAAARCLGKNACAWFFAEAAYASRSSPVRPRPPFGLR